jgi:hypothetical protein
MERTENSDFRLLLKKGFSFSQLGVYISLKFITVNEIWITNGISQTSIQIPDIYFRKGYDKVKRSSF